MNYKFVQFCKMMARMKKILTLLCVVLLSQSSYSQYESDYSIGVMGGISIGKIENLGEIIISEDYYSNYTLDENRRIKGMGGIFFNARIPETILAFQPEVSYSQKYMNLHYNDIYGLWYDMDFKYQFVNVGVMAKVYTVGGLNFEVGFQMGFNITPNHIEYHSNGEQLGLSGSDIETRDQLRKVLKGNNDFSVMAGVSYEFPFGLYIDGRYLWGVSDVVTTEYNPYKFIENKNKANSIVISVGYAYSFGKSSNRKHR